MKTRGFTLVEILVAITILTVVGFLAMGGYNQLLHQSELADNRMKRVRAIQSAVLKLSQDFAELEPRPVREPIGAGMQPALSTGSRVNALVQLTRAGWANPAGISRPTLQRVEYSLDNGTLYRTQHAVLDAIINDEPIKIALLDNVKSLRIDFLDVQQQWSPDWPRPGQQNSFRARPLAARFELELEDWGSISRVVEVSNVTVN
jgi:general secretion pathway protein J